jgi:hypothetical protein
MSQRETAVSLVHRDPRTDASIEHADIDKPDPEQQAHRTRERPIRELTLTLGLSRPGWAWSLPHKRLSLRRTTCSRTPRRAAAISSSPSTPMDPAPAGLILHVAGPTDEGFRMIDIWKSEQAWDRFQAERLAPAIAALGGPARPERRSAACIQHVVRDPPAR